MSRHFSLNIVLFTVFALAAGALAPAMTAAQESVLELAVEPFKESYAGDVEVSGNLLVALAYDPLPGLVSLDQIRLDFKGGAGETVCVRLTTSDGRYYALNIYRARNKYVDPPAIPLETRYEQQLESYEWEDFLALAFRGDCDFDEAQPIVAARLGQPAQPQYIVAYVNINRGRVTARLEQDGRRLAETACTTPPQGTHVVYSRICRLPTEAVVTSSPVKLVLELRSLTGAGLEETYEVFVW